MGVGRSWWVGGAVSAGFAIVLAPPALLLWNAMRPQPWNARSLRVRLESVRYDRGGLVFRYLVDNRTHQAAHFFPETTTIRVLQAPDRPPVGYPNVNLPLELPARAEQPVEIRLELPSPPGSPASYPSDEQTRRVLQHKLPDVSDVDSPVSRLPMRMPPAANPVPSAEPFGQDLLRNLDGFELVNERNGLRIQFPRRW